MQAQLQNEDSIVINRGEGERNLLQEFKGHGSKSRNMQESQFHI